MSAKPIVVGVDRSPESLAAVHLGWQIARAVGTQCHLVHAIGRIPTIPVMAASAKEQARLTDRLVDLAREELVETLTGNVPADAFRMLELAVGNPTWVLNDALRRHRAGLLVLGGKHHAAVSRWLGGSTAHHAVRTIDVPIFVTWAPRGAIRRILAAVDLSYAARATVAAARRFQELFKAELRVLHAIEPIPYFGHLPVETDEAGVAEASERRFQTLAGEILGDAEVDLVTRSGSAEAAIQIEAAEWNVDLVVLGTHGSNWVDRVLVGSTTERLLNRLPTSVLVVPVSPKAKSRGDKAAPAPGRSTVVM